ncbi:MAG: hypothetical protein HKN09_03110 [Saprospiraceae bacterium]|nr:hypothetical protein [Saprospiraceae bacterium]
MTNLTYTSLKTSGSLNLSLYGNLIHIDGLRLYQDILERLDNVNNVIIDLAHLNRIDLTGLNALMVCQCHLSGANIDLKIKLGQNRQLKELMQTTSVTQYLL